MTMASTSSHPVMTSAVMAPAVILAFSPRIERRSWRTLSFRAAALVVARLRFIGFARLKGFAALAILGLLCIRIFSSSSATAAKFRLSLSHLPVVFPKSPPSLPLRGSIDIW
jgi:hypothetical protein